jgi:predicted deacylase
VSDLIDPRDVPSGHKARGHLYVRALPEWAYPPLIVIRGGRDGPTLGVTAGVHGAEYSSIEAAVELGVELRPEDLVGSLILCPLVNVPAFQRRSIYVNPLDGINVNRVFPGRSTGTVSEQLARAVTEAVIEPSDRFVDLHGGDMVEALVPFVIYHEGEDPLINEASRWMAAAFGIPHLVRGRTPGSSYEAAAALGKPAILAEAGQQGIVSERAVALHRRGVHRLLEQAGMLTPAAAERLAAGDRAVLPDPEPPVVHEGWHWLNSPATGLWRPAVSCGDSVEEGDLLGVVRNVWGEEVAEVKAPAGGQVLFLVTSLAINEGDPLLAVGSARSR